MMRITLSLIFTLFIGFNTLPAQGAVNESAINQYDEQGRKTGHWVIKGHMINATNYKPDQKVEEGEYVANKREGLWKKYHTNGELKSEINYRSNRPSGPYKLYFPSGILEEDGNWIDERNTGEFKRYHPNGKVAQEFIFEDNGLRTGLQKYYYDNGQLELEVEIVKGLEEGLMRRYYPNGDVMEEKMLSGGVVKKGTVKKYPKKAIEEVEPERPSAVEVKHSVRNTEDKPNLDVFKFNGRNTLYNKNRQVTQIGEFKEGRLWNGKWRHYNKNGLLEKIEIYKEGVYIGNAPFTEDDM
jgi:antitoxin component YwqK of YwqJK toxin-antitoxin module